MKLHTVTTVLVVCSCIAAVGVASTTLETTFETNPDEVVDLDYETVPISPDDAGKLKRAMTQSDAGAERNQPAAGESGDEPRANPGAGEEERRQTNPAGGESRDQRADPADGDRSSGASESSDDGSGDTSTNESLLDRLLDLLAAWLPYLVVLAATSALLFRYRGRIVRFFGTSTLERERPAASRKPEPQNAVERAWLSVLAAADVDDPWQRTPAECATAAVESGLDPDGVERLRRVFEEVRYGGGEVTAERRRRMERGLSQLDLAGVGPRRVDR
jgi:hypothetical protein